MNYKNRLLILILGVALALRFVAVNQSLWLDESIGALVVRDMNYREILTEFSKRDNHPPLYYLALKGWSDLFGYSELALRSLSIFLGTVTVYVIYQIAMLVDKNKKGFATLSAALLATSGLHIYYSQEARMYVMAAFFGAAAVYYFLKTLKKRARRADWILFSLAIAALIFTDYIPVFLIPVFWIYALYIKPTSLWDKLDKVMGAI